jgi:hypothetical protein
MCPQCTCAVKVHLPSVDSAYSRTDDAGLPIDIVNRDENSEGVQAASGPGLMRFRGVGFEEGPSGRRVACARR